MFKIIHKFTYDMNERAGTLQTITEHFRPSPNTDSS